MSNWIPAWATHYRLKNTVNAVVIELYSKQTQTLGAKRIEELEKDLAIRDVVQQIKSANFGVDATKKPISHYSGAKSKYHHEIFALTCDCGQHHKVYVDVYRVLHAFKVKCHAIGHAIKKLLMPGNRHDKDFKQDCSEAVVSINRSIDEHV